MPFSLNDQVAAVTGSGSGIGKAIAVEFAKAGARVYILDKNTHTGEETAAEITGQGGVASLLPCDVSDQARVDACFSEILSEEGGVDILVNNAGIAHVGRAEDTAEEDFDRVYRVNVKGAYNCIRAVIPNMKASGGGVILNIASVAASVGISERFAYSVSKGAILAMTYQVAKDYLDWGIRCNSISPARVHTPFVDGYLAENYPGQEEEVFRKLEKTQPIGRMGKPDEIARLARFLCSREASFITGTDYPIDGGFIRLNT